MEERLRAVGRGGVDERSTRLEGKLALDGRLSTCRLCGWMARYCEAILNVCDHIIEALGQ